MTVSSETNKVSYAGNGSTTDFSTGFIFLEDSHILVTLVVDATGVETTQTITTDYTLTGSGTGSAGTVTMLTAPATGETLIISRNVPLTQGSDYVENDPFPAETHEEALDKLTMIAQQQQEELDRSLRFPLSVDSGVSNEIPAPTADLDLKFNSAGTAIEAIALAESIAEITYENLDTNGDVGFSSGQVPAGNLTMPLSQIGVTAGSVVQVDQALTATTRATTTTLGTSLNHTLSDTSTTITAFNGVAGVTYHCRTLGAGNITHHATNLIITQTGADITTAADDTFDVEMITGTTCRIKNYQRASGEALIGVNEKLAGDIVQIVNVQDGAVATGTTIIPLDDTIPQNTEGDEYMSLAITPTSATNILQIDVVAHAANSNNLSSTQSAALFQDSTTDAIAAAISGRNAVANASSEIAFTHRMVAGTTNTTTFKLRIGSSTAGTTTFNGASGSRLFGGVMASSMTITEIQA